MTTYTFERVLRDCGHNKAGHKPVLYDYHVTRGGEHIAIISGYAGRWELKDRTGRPVVHPRDQWNRHAQVITYRTRELWAEWLETVRDLIPTAKQIEQRKAAEAADRARRQRYADNADNADDIRDYLQVWARDLPQSTAAQLLAKLEGGRV